MPHILPCPAPRVAFADVEVSEDGKRRRRRRRTTVDGDSNTKDEKVVKEEVTEAQDLETRSHQCPVPRPTGLVGRVLGFGSDTRDKER